jgi:IS5 family transposase
MDTVIPWPRLLKLIEPHYPKAGSGTQPMPMERMLRIYFVQNWFNLSNPAAADSLYDSESMRRFAGIGLAEGSIADETVTLRIRHLLERRLRPRMSRRRPTRRCARARKAEAGTFGIKAHIATDVHGRAHSLATTP